MFIADPAEPSSKHMLGGRLTLYKGLKSGTFCGLYKGTKIMEAT